MENKGLATLREDLEGLKRRSIQTTNTFRNEIENLLEECGAIKPWLAKLRSEGKLEAKATEAELNRKQRRIKFLRNLIGKAISEEDLANLDLRIRTLAP